MKENKKLLDKDLTNGLKGNRILKKYGVRRQVGKLIDKQPEKGKNIVQSWLNGND